MSRVCTVLMLSLFCAQPALSETSSRFSTLVAAEAWDADNSPYHGVLLAAYDLSGLPAGARLSVVFNTDTLRLEYDGVRLAPTLEAGGRLTGEGKIANLLSDYFRDGENDLSRTFYASYLQGQGWLKWNPLSRTYLTLEIGARRWFFERRDATADALVLPAESLVLESRLHVAWWGLRDDAGWRDRHRLYPRLRGVAFGLSLLLNYQADVHPWGARNVADFDPIDPRNTPETAQFGFVQWVKGGWPLGKTLRFELEEELGWMTGEDDLSRRSAGGMMPYTVTVPGVPWAYFHVGDYLASQFSLRWEISEALELGPLASVAGLRDADRVGANGFDLLWGIGGVVDWRIGPWQIDVRGGVSPALATLHSSQRAWSALASFGWATE